MIVRVVLQFHPVLLLVGESAVIPQVVLILEAIPTILGHHLDIEGEEGEVQVILDRGPVPILIQVLVPILDPYHVLAHLRTLGRILVHVLIHVLHQRQHHVLLQEARVDHVLPMQLEYMEKKGLLWCKM